MNENKIKQVMLEELLMLWLEKNHPDEPVYFIMAAFLPTAVKYNLQQMGLESWNASPLFYVVPAEYTFNIRMWQKEYENRIYIINSDEIFESF